MLNMFSIFDDKVAAFIQPFFSPTIASAMREFKEACNNTNTNFHKHAGDYTLFHLGKFDPDNAEITMLDTPANLGLALTFVDQNPTVTAIHGGQ